MRGGCEWPESEGGTCRLVRGHVGKGLTSGVAMGRGTGTGGCRKCRHEEELELVLVERISVMVARDCSQWLTGCSTGPEGLGLDPSSRTPQGLGTQLPTSTVGMINTPARWELSDVPPVPSLEQW